MTKIVLRKMIRSIVLLSICCFSVLSGVNAQNRRPLDVLSTLNGLPTDEVKQIYQDKDGYIWIATYDGLCRYDGYQLKIYKANLYTPRLLSNNKINTVAEDGNHNLWIGTSNGLNILNKISGEIRQVDPRKLISSNIQVILTTKKNEVWIGTSAGILKYVAEKDSFIVYTNIKTNYQLPGNDIKTLFEDRKGCIWVGTWSNGISRYDPAKGRFFWYPRINAGNSAHVIFQDNKDNIWIGSWGYGLFRLENPYCPDRVKYISYRHEKNEPNSLSDDIVYSLSQDANSGAVWVGTRSGLSVLNDSNDPLSFVNYLPNQTDQSISYNEINSVLRDKSGLMWLGAMGGGVSTINTKKWMFHLNRLDAVKNRISSNSVRSLFVDNKGVIWMGIGSYGLVAYYRDIDKFVYYKDNPDFLSVAQMPTVFMVMQPRGSNQLWCATYGGGIYIYDPAAKHEKVKNINAATASWLYDDCVYCLKEDTKGNIWIGTSSGLSLYDPKQDRGYAYPFLGTKGESSVSNAINCIEKDGENSMWLASSNGGVIRASRVKDDPRKMKFHKYNLSNGRINSNNIQYIYKDSYGRVWSGSDGGGLSLYDADKDKFVCVHQKYNLPGDIVYNIVEDNNRALWIGTNSGLINLKIPVGGFDESKINYRLYTTSDGLQANSFNRNAVFKTKDGELFFGGHKGYDCFYPDRLRENDFMSPVVITDIKIFNKSLQSLEEKTRGKISQNAPGYTSEIKIPYNYNNFSIEFATLSYANPMQNKYAYKLVNFDKEWQYVDASRRFASYNNLKSGTYQFYLIASNENGIWSENKTMLRVVVLPPPWLTWWAFLIYFIVLIVSLYLGIGIAKSKILLKNALKVRDLEKQKTEELNHAKLQFFTNITHEFLTPLTILSASLDELKMIAPQNHGYYEVMSNNINRLIRLLQQILEFRKAETGNLKLKVSKDDLSVFVKSCVDSFRPLMKKNKMHFSLICDPESIFGYFDHDKLDKILYNLLSNASKYNKSGGFIQVNVSYDSATSNRVIISVKDNGKGIPSQEIKGLFKRFYEGDYRRFNTIGTGIGLSLTKDLVNLHRGEISVESEEGKGTVFFVKIPINRDAYDEEQVDDYNCISESFPLENVAEIDGGDQPKEDSKEFTLLLIEDNEELLQLMVRLLYREYNVLTARNGLEGVHVLDDHDVDLIVSDIMMPEMDGIALCKYVKNKFEISHVPIILLTAKNKEEDKIEAYDSGADGFISKPFNLNLLHAKIKNLLKTRERVIQDFKKQFSFEIKDMEYTSMDEKFLQRAFDCVHNHLDDSNFDQQQFIEEMGSSKSTLYKKLKSLTGLNTSAFIRNIRLKMSCKIIEEKKKIRISELAYAVGFNDPKYFSVCFKKEFGMIPSEYLDKILAREGIESALEEES